MAIRAKRIYSSLQRMFTAIDATKLLWKNCLNYKSRKKLLKRTLIGQEGREGPCTLLLEHLDTAYSGLYLYSYFVGLYNDGINFLIYIDQAELLSLSSSLCLIRIFSFFCYKALIFCLIRIIHFGRKNIFLSLGFEPRVAPTTRYCISLTIYQSGIDFT